MDPGTGLVCHWGRFFLAQSFLRGEKWGLLEDYYESVEKCFESVCGVGHFVFITTDSISAGGINLRRYQDVLAS